MMARSKKTKGIGDADFSGDGTLPEGSLIIQVGTYPPPLGGVSMRIKRLSALINKTAGRCVVFSPKQTPTHPSMVSSLQFVKLIARNSWSRSKKRLLVHLQHTNLQTFRLKWYAFIRLVRLCGGNVVVSLGGLWYDVAKLPHRQRLLFSFVTRQVDRYIAVGPHIADTLIQGGCPKDKVSVIPGFIPPDEEELSDPKSVPEDLESFFQKHSPIITANASGVVFLGGRDLYGLDMCLELTDRLRNSHPNLGFVYAIAPGGHGSEDNWDYLKRMRQTLRRLKLEPHFYIRICSEPFTPLLKRCDVFVRPTCTDGDANSIREALYLRKPVVASDPVSRPQACLIYTDGDMNDFCKKVSEILADYKYHQERIAQLKISFPHNDLLRLYSKILGPQSP